MHRFMLAALAALVFGSANADNRIMGEIEIEAATKLELDAGVWLDDQYVGFVKDLRGNGRIVTTPGEHKLVFQLVGYEEVERTVIIEPGDEKRYRVTMRQASGTRYPEKAETARVRIRVEPEEAAVFVNGEYVGPVHRFAGRSGMRMSPGSYRFKIALPGYQAFETELTVLASQSYELKTRLLEGSILDQPGELAGGIAQAD